MDRGNDEIDVDSVRSDAGENLNKIDLNLDDEVNLEEFTYREDFVAGSKLQGEITFVPVRRPDPQSWVYITSKSEMRANVPVLELKQQRETYLVRPEVAACLDGETSHRMLVPYADRDGGFFLWAVRFTDARGNPDSWSISAQRICTEYTDRWIKIKSKMSTGCYDVIIAPIEIPPPEWPAGGLQFLVNRAFKNKIINSLDDPVIKRLKGLV